MFVNLTPHTIVLQSTNGNRIPIPPSGVVARISSSPGPLIDTLGDDGCDDGIPVYDKTTYGEPEGLPEYVELYHVLRTDAGGSQMTIWAGDDPTKYIGGIGCIPLGEYCTRKMIGPVDRPVYIVSALFAGRVNDRPDVMYPGTGPNDGCVRDDKGQVVAVTRLIRA